MQLSPDELTPEIIAIITEARKDIDFIHFDEAYFEDCTKEWVIPCEAKLPTDEGIGWMHGDLLLSEFEGELDYSVGNWTDGLNPQLHTFER